MSRGKSDFLFLAQSDLPDFCHFLVLRPVVLFPQVVSRAGTDVHTATHLDYEVPDVFADCRVAGFAVRLEAGYLVNLLQVPDDELLAGKVVSLLFHLVKQLLSQRPESPVASTGEHSPVVVWLQLDFLPADFLPPVDLRVREWHLSTPLSG